jgi:hypothetical protein
MMTDLAELPGYGPSLPFGHQTSAEPVSHHRYVLLSLSASLESRPA